jgi:carbamoyl-phosphate synthase large subunit
MKRNKYCIAVTGLNNTDNPGPGVPVIRGLREAASFDVRIIGLVYENLEPGIYMENVCDRIYQIPYPSSGSDLLIDRLEYINSKEQINILIPNFDAELHSFMKAEKRLLGIGIHTFLPTFSQFEERHKANLPDFGKKYGVSIPHSQPISSTAEIEKLYETFEYPLLVKGKYYDASVAFNPHQAAEYFNKISAKWGLPIIIQQFVRGTEVNVIALGDGKGNTIAAVPMRKQYITDKGKAWGGITIADNKLLEMTRKLISQTKWRGGMELEIIKTHDGQYFIIEINPRIPAWVYLAVAAGQNIPEALVKLSLGETVEPFKNYEIGKMFIRYSYDMIGNIAQFEQLSITGEMDGVVNG